MQEILFRGKRTDNGEWVYGKNIFISSTGVVSITASGDAVYLGYHGLVGCDISQSILMPFNEVDPSTVGQFTGLYDRNGKKIFEGDICRNVRTLGISSVKWHGSFAGYVWSRRKDGSNLYEFGELFRVQDKCEVIGNIHDNPELLEGL